MGMPHTLLSLIKEDETHMYFEVLTMKEDTRYGIEYESKGKVRMEKVD